MMNLFVFEGTRNNFIDFYLFNSPTLPWPLTFDKLECSRRSTTPCRRNYTHITGLTCHSRIIHNHKIKQSDLLCKFVPRDSSYCKWILIVFIFGGFFIFSSAFLDSGVSNLHTVACYLSLPSLSLSNGWGPCKNSVWASYDGIIWMTPSHLLRSSLVHLYKAIILTCVNKANSSLPPSAHAGWGWGWQGSNGPQCLNELHTCVCTGIAAFCGGFYFFLIKIFFETEVFFFHFFIYIF